MTTELQRRWLIRQRMAYYGGTRAEAVKAIEDGWTAEVYPPPAIGRVYRRIGDGVPRVVVSVRDDAVVVCAPGGSVAWPVKQFWSRYRPELPSERRLSNAH